MNFHPSRFFDLLSRLSISISILGVFSSLLLYANKFSSNKICSVKINKLNRIVYFRGKSDWGVMSHFYRPGYRIVDTESEYKIKMILDIGSNIGTQTLRFHHFHVDANIVSIEADPSNFNILKRNITGLKNIFPLNYGLYNKDCKLRVINHGDTNESFRVYEVSEFDNFFDTYSISMVKLIEMFHIDSIDILKLDIEGAEKYIFDSSCSEWIKIVKCMIIECPDSDAPGTTMKIFNSLLSSNLKFNIYIHGENLIFIKEGIGWRSESVLLSNNIS